MKNIRKTFAKRRRLRGRLDSFSLETLPDSRLLHRLIYCSFDLMFIIFRQKITTPKELFQGTTLSNLTVTSETILVSKRLQNFGLICLIQQQE